MESRGDTNNVRAARQDKAAQANSEAERLRQLISDFLARRKGYADLRAVVQDAEEKEVE